MKNEQAKQSALIHTLYSSFAQRDYKTMAECYHPEARFKDEVFELKGNEIAAMWHMLCVRGKDRLRSGRSFGEYRISKLGGNLHI